jgi:hypothetical protein
MDDYSLPSSPPPYLLIASLGVDCKFAVPYNKKIRYSWICDILSRNCLLKHSLKVRWNRREEKSAEGQRREEEEKFVNNYCMLNFKLSPCSVCCMFPSG